MRTIDKIITKVNSRFGAPMGRINVGDRRFDTNLQKMVPNTDKKVFDCAVPMVNGGYDRGGAYWGLGRQLRVQYSKDLSYVWFYRMGEKNF